MSDVDPKPETTPEPTQEDVVLDKFEEIKNRYEKELESKDSKIKELEEQLKKKDREVSDTVQNLNNEVNEKLAQAEELKQLQQNVNELLIDKANAIVDKFINEGKIAPVQREKALDVCLSNQDMFIELYENAPSIVDTSSRPKSHKVPGNIDKMVDYFKN